MTGESAGEFVILGVLLGALCIPLLGEIVGVTLIVVLSVYFLPTICAATRRCRGRSVVFALNLLLGWTLVGWVVTFIWANAAPKE